MGILQNYMQFIYLGLKVFLFFSLALALIKAEPLRQQTFFLALLYTLGVAFLSYVFLIAPGVQAFWANWRQWQIWLGITFALAFVYFRLLAWTEESVFFWLVISAGFLVVSW
ncbi:MAG: hypothetical protein ACKO5R_13460 [Planctomycetaceae bacterium]